jgi:hypothetical protein
VAGPATRVCAISVTESDEGSSLYTPLVAHQGFRTWPHHTRGLPWSGPFNPKQTVGFGPWAPFAVSLRGE